MKDIYFEVLKEDVYKEVAKTTSYIGAKRNEEGHYDRIFTTDEDSDMLERFWGESKSELESMIKDVFLESSEDRGCYILTLGASLSFLENLQGGMQKTLFSFFVTNIISKWCSFMNKEAATDYALLAAKHLDEFSQKAFFKRRPMRQEYGLI